MRKSGIRLFTPTIGTATLLAVAMASTVEAAGNGGKADKPEKKIQTGGPVDLRSAGSTGSPGFGDLRSPTGTFPPPLYDDFDRKNGGAGGM